MHPDSGLSIFVIIIIVVVIISILSTVGVVLLVMKKRKAMTSAVQVNQAAAPGAGEP